MQQPQSTGRDERVLRQYDYEDQTVLALDLNAGDVDVDIVGTTAIVVAERGDQVREAEFELPGAATAVSSNNGVVTITVESESRDIDASTNSQH